MTAFSGQTRSDCARRELKLLEMAGALRVKAGQTEGNAASLTNESNSLRRELALQTDERAETEMELLNAVAALEVEKVQLANQLTEMTLERDAWCEAVENVERDKNREIVDLQADLDKAVTKLAEARQEVQQLINSKKSEAESNEVKNLSATLLNAQNEVHAKDTALSVSSELLKNKESENIRHRQEIKYLKEANRLVSRDLLAKDNELAKLKAELRKFKEESVSKTSSNEETIAMIKAELASKNVDITKAKELVKSRDIKIAELEQCCSELKDVQQEARSDILAKEEALARINAELRSRGNELADVNTLLKQKENKISQSHQIIKKLETEKSQLTTTGKEKTKEIEENNMLRVKLSDIESQLASKENALADMHGQLETKNIALDKANEVVAQKDTDIAQLQSTIIVSSDEVARLARHTNEKDIENAKLRGHISDLRQKEDQLAENLQAMTKDLMCKDAEIKTLCSTVTGLRRRKEQVVAKLDEVSEECKSLQVMNDSYSMRIEVLLDSENASGGEIQDLNESVRCMKKERQDALEQNDKLKDRIASLEAKVDESNIRNVSLNHEVQVMRSVLSLTENKNDNLQHQIANLNQEILRMKEYEFALCNKLKLAEEDAGARMRKRSKQISSEVSRHLEEIRHGKAKLQDRLKSKEEELTTLQISMDAMRRDIELLSSELKRKSEEMVEKDNLIQSLAGASLKTQSKADCIVCVESGGALDQVPTKIAVVPNVVSPEPTGKYHNNIDDIREADLNLLNEVMALSTEFNRLKDNYRRLRQSKRSSGGKQRNDKLKAEVDKAFLRLKALELANLY